jgi:hypothetical protein
MNMSNQIVINADVMWAQLDNINDLSGKYQCDFAQLSDGAVAALEAAGVAVKFKDDRGSYITCKSTHPIKAVTSEGESLEGVKVGNGSKAVAVITTFEWTFKGKKGVSPSLKKMVVKELVVFDEDENSEVGSFNLDEAL